MSPGLTRDDKKAIGGFANRWPWATVIIVLILVSGATVYWSTKALADSADMADFVKRTELDRMERKVDALDRKIEEGFREQRERTDQILLRLSK